MRTRYYWTARTWDGRFARAGVLLRWLAPRRTSAFGTADTFDDGLAAIQAHLAAVAAVSPDAHTSVSCHGYLHDYGRRDVL